MIGNYNPVVITVAGVRYALLDLGTVERAFDARVAFFESNSSEADCLVLFDRSKIADVRIEVYNADGREISLCGSSLCAIVKYFYDRRFISEQLATVETVVGIKEIKIGVKGGAVCKTDVDMGRALFDLSELVAHQKNGLLRFYPVVDGDVEYSVTLFDLGDRYAVSFIGDHIESADLSSFASRVRCHPDLSDDIFVIMVQKEDEREFVVRALTPDGTELVSSGSVACAVAVASAVCGVCEFDTRMTIKFSGGVFEAVCDRDLCSLLVYRF